MLMPRKTKFRKQHRGRRRGTSKGQLTVQYGDYGLKALDAAGSPTARSKLPESP